MIGILMAGGKGKRLLPSTSAISKHLFPIYDKPMIYYSLSIFFMCKIKNVIIIADENNILFYKKLLGNGEKFGIKLDYLIQNNANGIAEGILISERNQLLNEFKSALEFDGPALINVLVRRGENCYPMVPPGKSNAQMVGYVNCED